MLVLQRGKPPLGNCNMPQISGKTKLFQQNFAVSWLSVHSTTVVLKPI